MATSALRALVSSTPGGGNALGRFRLASFRALVTILRPIAGAGPAQAAAASRDVGGAIGQDRGALSRLSVREREIVTMLLAGDRVPAIAQSLHLTQSTVRNHLSSVFRKLRVSSQQELIYLLRDP